MGQQLSLQLVSFRQFRPILGVSIPESSASLPRLSRFLEQVNRAQTVQLARSLVLQSGVRTTRLAEQLEVQNLDCRTGQAALLHGLFAVWLFFQTIFGRLSGDYINFNQQQRLLRVVISIRNEY